MKSEPTNNAWVEASAEKIVQESPTVKTFTFKTSRPATHWAGQHYELRLTAENGYQAARLYSAALPGNGDPTVTLSIVRVPDGEVSPYVVDNLSVGDSVEIRGPFGHFFTWSKSVDNPILLIGGGSGIVPIHAIYESHKESGAVSQVRVIYSEHRFDDILYKNDFLDQSDVRIALTKEWPDDWSGYKGRLTTDLLEDTINSFDQLPLCYVCGMNGFVNAVADGLQALGVPATSIKTERFG